jgi:HEAT repeat protein
MSESPALTAYLALAVGNFQTLDARLTGGQKIDPLEILSEGLDPKQPDQVRIASAYSLAKHAARLDGKLDDERAIRALAATAAQGEPQVRRVAVYALGFFGGGEVVSKLLRERLDDEDRDVRYNAAVALGRRDDLAARAILREMLSSSDLERVIEAENTDEKRSRIELLENEALNALQTAVNQGHTALARALTPELETLSKSGLVAVRTNALALLRTDALLKSAP